MITDTDLRQRPRAVTRPLLEVDWLVAQETAFERSLAVPAWARESLNHRPTFLETWIAASWLDEALRELGLGPGAAGRVLAGFGQRALGRPPWAVAYQVLCEAAMGFGAPGGPTLREALDAGAPLPFQLLGDLEDRCAR